MNIYDFFNSPDVAEHCRGIDHTFNAVESAVIISQSKTRTLAEKHNAYKIIIAEYTDMEAPEGNNHRYIKSFHKALAGVVTFQERLLEKLLLPEPSAIYQVATRDRNECKLYEHDAAFSTYEKALAYALSQLTDVENTSLGHIPASDIKIHKKYLDSEDYIYAMLRRSGDILNIDWNCDIAMDADDNSGLLLDTFYIDIPVPFKRGDLVEFPHTSGGWMGDVFVLQDICRNNREQNANLILRGDLMDMTAGVYYEHNGLVDCECIHFYPDLQYCRRELKDEKRILKYISLYMQDKLCLCDLLKIQEYLSLDKNISKLKDNHSLKSLLL